MPCPSSLEPWLAEITAVLVFKEHVAMEETVDWLLLQEEAEGGGGGGRGGERGDDGRFANLFDPRFENSHNETCS